MPEAADASLEPDIGDENDFAIHRIEPMSRKLSGLIVGFAQLATWPLSERQKAKTFSRVRDHFDRAAIHTIETKHGDLEFYANRGAALASALHTFHSDEPETIRWIDEHVRPGEVLWDIGANVGLFACYAAKAGARVVAFEPSGINFGSLVEHIELNGLGDSVDAYCLGLSDSSEATSLYMSAFELGHSHSSVGRPESQFKVFDPRFRQAILVFSADDLVERLALARPDHLKLDVDGNELLILQGAKDVLATAKTAIIEIEGTNAERFEETIRPLLEAAGLAHVAPREPGARNQLFVRR